MGKEDYMDEKNWLERMVNQSQTVKVMETNQYTEKYGLTLSREDAQLLTEERKNVLKEQRRVEFGGGIMPKLIYAFCDSSYINQDQYVPALIRLQEIFYLYKNETQDELTDDELVNFMREQFENICYGDLDYLEGTCLSIFSEAVRAGYRGYRSTEGRSEYGQFDEVQRWDRDLYLSVLEELFWG